MPTNPRFVRTRKDVPLALMNVRFEGKNGHDADVSIMSAFDPKRTFWGSRVTATQTSPRSGLRMLHSASNLGRTRVPIHYPARSCADLSIGE